MKENTLRQFKAEFTSFFVIVLLNMAFGALVMAFGMQFIVSSVLGLTGEQPFMVIRILMAAISMVCFGLGLTWVLTSAKVLKRITRIRREYRNRKEPVSDEILTGWIVRTMSHYRENKKIISWMTRISSIGGCIFLVFGIFNVFQGFSTWTPGDITTLILPIIAGAINMAIGLVSLRITLYFRRYSVVWDRRLDEVSRSEQLLVSTMEKSYP